MPYVPQDVLDRLAALERQVRQLAGRSQMRPALNRVLNGDVQIGEGGQLIVKSATGVSHLTVGDLPSMDNSGREFGVVIRRRDGSTALSVWNGSGDVDEPQAMRVEDARGHGLLVEDVTAGGLYRPWLAYPDLAEENTLTWPTTSSTSFETVEQGNGIAQHPRVQVLVSLAGTGQVRLLINDQTVATSSVSIDTTVEVPDYEYGARVNFKVQARANSSSSAVFAKTRYLYGTGSAG